MTGRGHVFVSYARADDAAFAARLRDDLTAAGVAVWWDKAAMESRGAGFLQELQDAIRSADRVVLVTGPAAAASDYVRAEWEFALTEACTPVVPVFRLGGADAAPPGVRHLHGVDFGDDDSYRDSLAELTRILGTPPAALGPLLGVAGLPPYHVDRRDVELVLARSVVPDLAAPEVLPREQSVTSLVGLPGAGKSVTTAAFARRCTTRWAFGDGIAWVRVGRSGTAAGVVRRLAERFGIEHRGDPASQLADHLGDRRCLIVLDDVWEPHVVEEVADVVGPVCRVLLTTQRGDLAVAAGRVEVDVLGAAPARALLARAARVDKPAALPVGAAAVLDECGGLPLALAMVGAALAGKPADRWATMLERLRAARLDDIRHRLPRYDHPSLLAAMDAAAAALADDPDVPEHAGARYGDLAVFGRDAEFPEAALAVLWEPCGLDAGATQDLADQFVSRSLLRRAGGGRYTLHDLQADYLRSTHPDVGSVHARLVDAYGDRCGRNWAGGPDDGHFFQSLAAHMHDAGRDSELRRLLGDPAWIAAKLAATDPWAVAGDEALVPGDAGTLRMLYEALRRSAPVVAVDAGQLAPQLLGRLGAVDDPTLGSVLAHLRDRVDGPWLEPVWPTLDPPGGPLVWSLDGHAGGAFAVAVTPGGDRAAVGTGDGEVVLWDLETGRRLRSFRGPAAHVWAVAVTDDCTRVAAAFGADGVAVWEVATGAEVATGWDRETTVQALAFAAGGSRLIVGTGEGEVHVAGSDGAGTGPMEGRHDAAVQAMAAAPDGRRVVTGSQDGAVAVWDVAAGRQVALTQAHGSQVWSVALDRAGARCLSVADHGTVALTSVPAGDLLASFNVGSWAFGCCIVEAGDRAVTCDEGGELKIWSLPDGERLGAVRAHDGMADRVAAAGGPLVISASRDGSARVWDLDASGAPAAPEHEGPVLGVAVSTDVRGVLSASQDGTAMARVLDGGEPLGRFRLPRWARRVAFVPGTTCFLVGDADGIVHLVNARGLEQLGARRLHVPAVGPHPEGGTGFGLGGVTGLGMAAPVAWSVGSAGDLGLWHLERDEVEGGPLDVSPPVVGALSGDGQMAVFGDGDGRLLAGAPAEQRLRIVDLSEPVAAFLAVAIDGAGQVAVSSHVDGAVMAWRLGERPQHAWLVVPGPVAGTIMDFESGLRLPLPESLRTPPVARGLAVAPDGRIAFGAFSDGWLRVWDVAALAEVACFKFDEALFSCAVDGAVVAVGGARRVHALELHPGAPQDPEPPSSFAIR